MEVGSPKEGSKRVDGLSRSSGIHPGEVSVISFALELGATAILDDRRARQVARVLGVRLSGTPGIVIEPRQAKDDIKGGSTACSREDGRGRVVLQREGFLEHNQSNRRRDIARRRGRDVHTTAEAIISTKAEVSRLRIGLVSPAVPMASHIDCIYGLPERPTKPQIPQLIEVDGLPAAYEDAASRRPTAARIAAKGPLPSMQMAVAQWSLSAKSSNSASKLMTFSMLRASMRAKVEPSVKLIGRLLRDKNFFHARSKLSRLTDKSSMRGESITSFPVLTARSCRWVLARAVVIASSRMKSEVQIRPCSPFSAASISRVAEA